MPLKELTLVNSSMPVPKLPFKPVTFYQSAQSQKVPLFVMLKNIQVTKVPLEKPQELQLPLLVTLMMVLKPELDYHLVKEKLYQDYVDVPLVL